MKHRLIAGTINRYPDDDGWENLHVDINDRPIYHQALKMFVRPDVVCDLTDPARMLHTFQTARFDEVRCHHVLEHVSLYAGQAMLHNLVLLLKPDGVLDVEVPDITLVMGAWEAGDIGYDEFQQWLYGEELRDHTAADNHRAAYTDEVLRAALEGAGLDPGVRIEAGLAIRFRATKPQPQED